MKVKVSFTVELTESDLSAIGDLYGKKTCSRKDAKIYLQSSAEGALEELTGNFEQFRSE